MLISHNKRFIFFHNYKVAGSSIRDVLGGYANISLHRSTLIDRLKFKLGIYPPILSNSYFMHIYPAEVKSLLPQDIWSNYFKFGFVRNPYDWQVSLYKYMLKEKGHFQHDLISKMKNFDEYIVWRCSNNNVKLQKDFFFDTKNICLVDYIGKMENLQADFNIVCDRIKIHHITLPHLNISNTVDYIDYYSPKTINLVNKYFKEDFELFGYQII